MIGKLTGRIEYRALDHILVDVRGVGYLVYCSERTMAALPSAGQVCTLFTDLVVREDLMQLFGFITLVEKEWHRLLTSVQGVGAKASLAILGTLGADGVSRAIALGDWNTVKAAKGIGPKIAQRIVLDLKDKAPILMAMGETNANVSEPASARAESARVLGADLVLNPMEEDVVERVLELSGGPGVPVAFDAAAARPTFQQGMEMIRREGQLLVVSMAWEDVELRTVDWIGREVEMKAAYGSLPIDWRTVLNLMERGQLSEKSMVTDESFIGWDEMQVSMERLMKPEEHVQLVLVP